VGGWFFEYEYEYRPRGRTEYEYEGGRLVGWYGRFGPHAKPRRREEVPRMFLGLFFFCHG